MKGNTDVLCVWTPQQIALSPVNDLCQPCQQKNRTSLVNAIWFVILSVNKVQLAQGKEERGKLRNWLLTIKNKLVVATGEVGDG